MSAWWDAYGQWSPSLQFLFSCIVFIGTLGSLWSAGYAYFLVKFRTLPTSVPKGEEKPEAPDEPEHPSFVDAAPDILKRRADLTESNGRKETTVPKC
jgi:hypothetical protein